MTLHLEDRERLILHSALLNGNKSAEIIGEAVGYPGYRVRRSLSSIQKNGIAHPYTLVNQFALGYMKIGVYFSLRPAVADKIGEVVKRLLGYDEIVSLIELFGPYQYFMSVTTKSIRSYELLMAKISSDIPEFRIDEAVAIRHSLSLFKRKYLCPEANDTSALTYSMTDLNPEIDPVSIQVLNAIVSNGGFPDISEIEKQLNISAAIIRGKIKELEDKNIIVGYSYSIDPQKLGMYPYDLLVKASTHDSKFKKKLFSYCQKHLSIVGLTECVGNWQYEVRIEVPSPSEATQLTQEMYALFKDQILRIDTVSVCKEIRYMKTPKLSKAA